MDDYRITKCNNCGKEFDEQANEKICPFCGTRSSFRNTGEQDREREDIIKNNRIGKIASTVVLLLCLLLLLFLTGYEKVITHKMTKIESQKVAENSVKNPENKTARPVENHGQKQEIASSIQDVDDTNVEQYIGNLIGGYDGDQFGSEYGKYARVIKEVLPTLKSIASLVALLGTAALILSIVIKRGNKE